MYCFKINSIRLIDATIILLALFLTILPFGILPANASGIVISEIMYNPVDASDGTDGDEFEFIELYNTGTQTENLTGYTFTNGINYAFTSTTTLAPGAYLVIVKNVQFFDIRYPSVINIAPGEYDGSLSNSGEKITFKDLNDETIVSVEYNDSSKWPAKADGMGSSLVIADYEGIPDDPDTWADSGYYNGSPGKAGFSAATDIVINEVLTHSDAPQEDAIELYNLTSTTIDISNWYLTDDAGIPKKYQIEDTSIEPNGYAVIYEYQFAGGGQGDDSFALNSVVGDSVYLFAADSFGDITRFVDAVEFEASENGVSFGRYPNGKGTLITLDNCTFGITDPENLGEFRTGTGAKNSSPKTGPIVINERMYHPPETGNPPEENTANEYIELHNISEGAVALFDVDTPSNTWKITSGIDFSFPINVTIPAGGYIIIVADVEAFQSAHSFSTGISVYGPWAGKLSNSGEELKLYKPDTPEIDIVPYILVDSVDYKDSQAWSLGADGEGYSLERKAIPGLGSDSDNWQTSPLDGSPGRENGSSSTNCFIATAAFGSPMEREVKALRDFRDRHLLNSSPGHAFVHTYYKYSPTFAAFIARHDSLRDATRVMLMPLVGFVKIVLSQSSAEHK